MSPHTIHLPSSLIFAIRISFLVRKVSSVLFFFFCRLLCYFCAHALVGAWNKLRCFCKISFDKEGRNGLFYYCSSLISFKAGSQQLLSSFERRRGRTHLYGAPLDCLQRNVQLKLQAHHVHWIWADLIVINYLSKGSISQNLSKHIPTVKNTYFTLLHFAYNEACFRTIRVFALWHYCHAYLLPNCAYHNA